MSAAAAVAVTAACAGCGACLLTCPESAIRPDGGSLLVLAARCTGCLECIEVCPVDAVIITGAPAGGWRLAEGAPATEPERAVGSGQ